MSKIIFVDWGIIMFRSIFSNLKNKRVPATYTAISMLIGNLKKVGIDKEDIVIIAADSPKGSWRKEVDSAYKANRKKAREKFDINWKEQFRSFWNLLEKLEMYTPFHTISLDKLEADDIIAYACKKFQDQTCVVISSDGDYEQLFVYPNVKIFSPISKHYKAYVDPYKVLAKKIEREASDNLITPILNELDFEKRNKIVNLMTLPKEIEEQINGYFDILPEKDWDIQKLPYVSLHDRFETIYEKNKVVDINKIKRKKRKKGDKVNDQ